MKLKRTPKLSPLALMPLVALVLFPCSPVQSAPKKLAPIIAAGASGHLVYDVDAQGNRVPDFSACGYAGGDRPIPEVPVRVVVAAVAGDETARVQKAMDYVAGLPADAQGIRGAVLLLKGRHEIAGELRITHSGVVLRGQGRNEDGTVLVATGTDRRTLICLAGRNDLAVSANPGWQIADGYVPVGAASFHVKDASGLSIGEAIDIVRPSTKEWIEALGMTEFGGGLNDWRLVWHPGNYDLTWDRSITKIDGTMITVDAPVTTAMETAFGGGVVKAYSWPGRIGSCGVENLRLESAFDATNTKDEDHAWCAITLENAADAWVRQVTFAHFAGSAVAVYENCKRVTVADCVSLAPVSENGGWRRNTYFTMGQQTLFLRCRAEGGRHDFAAGHCAAGPNAFVECESDLPAADSGAIESWSSGTLFDNVRVDGGALNLMNRGADGEGAGWSAANSVLWNCIAARISCENPPGAQNWAFGSWGEFAGNGYWRNSNSSSKPDSLFAAQLAERTGDTVALASSVPSAAVPPGAKPAEDLPDQPANTSAPKVAIHVTHGWLVGDGKLLAGGVHGVNWWKGNLLPNDVKNYGATLTRFTPGRNGAGLTDDLNEIADEMAAGDCVAFDHHYGLWYDRRREDHERVRRMSGDVWPPFYEQPFARTGQGTAWDGLSLYDLTRFNRWYWARLKAFAELCDTRGLVLFNENYFQHNILEDGAHWVDCPWRAVNNVNGTGFQEPAYEVAKRIVMADQFYDVSNPVRRKLHEGLIRQNLDNFTNEANVIQFTSGEFTGPLAFEQFWLDTIGDWETRTKRHPLIALAATKDVQDAILADPKRAAVVDVICFRYWWQTDRGLFAPEGGQNLSPRQFERQWKGGAPNDQNLAAMASEYRRKYPDKVVIAAGEDVDMGRGAWAFLCAGGSLPHLPRTTDVKLLAAIPRMQPWLADANAETWALREPGKQILVFGRSGTELDLTAESGTFRINLVDGKTGEVEPGATVSAGGKLKLPGAAAVWLVKE